MNEYSWRKFKVIKVPDPQTVAWTPAIEFLILKRLYRLKVKADTTWQVDGASSAYTADGDCGALPRSTDPLCTTAPFGALIAKVGGGTADNIGVIFSVGRYCIFQITDEAKVGPLYLGVNDIPAAMRKVAGQLEVEIEIAF